MLPVQGGGVIVLKEIQGRFSVARSHASTVPYGGGPLRPTSPEPLDRTRPRYARQNRLALQRSSPPAGTHDNHETRFMMFRIPGQAGPGDHLRRGMPVATPGPAGIAANVQLNRLEVSVMKWETPQAIDFRFGMEITMYIANR